MRPKLPLKTLSAPTIRSLLRRLTTGPPATGISVLFLLLVSALVWTSGCSKSPTGSELALNNCTACHTSQAQLVATAEADDGGEGGTPGEG
jgi:hypothetical protein